MYIDDTFTWHHSAVMSEEDRVIMIILGAHLPYNFIQPPAIGTLSREQEVVQPLPDNAEKELQSYKANSSGGIALLYVCILGYSAAGYPA